MAEEKKSVLATLAECEAKKSNAICIDSKSGLQTHRENRTEQPRVLVTRNNSHNTHNTIQTALMISLLLWQLPYVAVHMCSALS